MDLKKIISQDESETVEFKKSPSESKKTIKTISAFANTKGGRPPYKRIGKSTLRMPKDEYGRGVLHTPFQERIILEKHKDKLYFDSQICKEATLADIDKEKIRWFLKEG
jgi:ATP-dependent DNA helicase RecG